MLTYDLNKRNKITIYEYLYQCIRDDILSGVLQNEEKLPSKRALSAHLKVGINTVEKAYELLLLKGLIKTKERSGYYVCAPKGKAEKERIKNTNKHVDHENSEQNFYMDFKANRISLKKFPVSVWSRYMRETLSLQDETLYKPLSYKGLYRLRAAISEYLLRNRGMKVDPELIIIGAGTEYLYGRLLQLLGRDCIFAMEDPGYSKIAKIAESFGNRREYVPIDEDGLQVDLLEECGADVIHVSPSNHFPTGTVMPLSRRRELLNWANRINKRYIVEDDYDSEFRYYGEMFLPLFTEDIGEKVIYMNTFSKTLVPTLRISYMILPKRLMKRYEDTMSFYSCTVSTFEQYSLARFIEDGQLEKHINHMRNYYQKIRNLVLKEIDNSPLSLISRIEEHNAGTHFLLHVKTNLSEKEVRDRALQEDMHLNLYSDYSENTGSEDCTLVINYASIEAEQIKDVIRRLERVFAASWQN